MLYVGAKVAGHVAVDVGEHALAHAGEDAVEHVAQHELEDVAEHGAQKEVLLDTSAVYQRDASENLMHDGEKGVISETTAYELQQNADRGVMQVPQWANELDVVSDSYDHQTARSLRSYMESFQAVDQGRANDVIIGTTSLVTGRPLITADRTLYEAVRVMGGDSRLICGF